MAAGPEEAAAAPSTFSSSFPRSFFGTPQQAGAADGQASTVPAPGGAEAAFADAQTSTSSAASSNGPAAGAASVAVGVTHTLEWHVAAYTVPWKKTTKTILQNIAGRTQTGELTAIMGPSGCGKTTLLECVSLRNRHFEGSVHIDGALPAGDVFTLSAFVHQKELLFGYMTPREYLAFNARAKMARGYTKEQREQRVNEVLEEMKLAKCADTLVGGGDLFFSQKGLSGGERKRLAIANEMLLAPSMIFLDEPSSGLDSVMSESIFASLKDLADNGRVVMASVHCPSSEACTLFTHLLLLSCDGRLAYHGPMRRGLGYFASLKYFCPEHYNPADFYLKLVSFAPGGVPELEAARMEQLTAAYAGSDMAVADPLPADETHKHHTMVRGLQASSWTLFVSDSWRALLRLKRDMTFVALWGIISALVGALLGIIYWQQASGSWRNLLGLVFALVVADLFMGSLGIIMRFPTEWAIIVREYYAGTNSVGPYLISNFLCNIPMAYGPVALVTLVYWLTGMEKSFGAYLRFVGIYLSMDISCMSLGQFVSSLSANPMVSMTILPAFVAPMIMFSGVLYQKSTVPAWLGWIQHISIVNYAFSAMMAEQMHILPANQQKVLADFIDLNDNGAGVNVVYLWCMIGVLQFLTYCSLSWRLRAATAS